VSIEQRHAISPPPNSFVCWRSSRVPTYGKYNNLPRYRSAEYTCSTRFVPSRGEQHTQSATYEDVDGSLTDNAANYRIA
jgi:hypothetical protein